MASVCLYFQVHQPYRLRRYSVFDSDGQYFDDARNQNILQRVVDKCYLPASKLLLSLINQHEDRFRVAFSLTGTVIEQLRDHHPQVMDVFVQLAETGCVEFLSETYQHSLAFIYSKDEFKRQVDEHRQLIVQLFGQNPRVFRNTELIYHNDLASTLHSWGQYQGILSEGVDRVLGARSPNMLFHPPGLSDMKLLLKNYRLSDDIAFRFSNRSWTHWPLTAEKLADWIARIASEGPVCNLFMDYETFGEHQWKDTGIFEFLQALPGAILNHPGQPGLDFKTPSQCIESYPAADVYDVPSWISWADTERDISAWLGNAMQTNAMHDLYKLESQINASGNTRLINDWRRLTCSDHFYYMCTKYFADGDVHKYFNPYESPYDSYINFMNVLDSLRTRMES